MRINVSDISKQRLFLGWTGENKHLIFAFNCDDIFAEYTDADASMTIQPPKGDSYPHTLTREGNVLLWEVLEADCTHKGNGAYQITFTQGEHVAKSLKGFFTVRESLIGSGDAPEPVQNWIADAEAALFALTGMRARAETLDPGAAATAQIVEENGRKVIVLGVPEGRKGDPGEPGDPGKDGEDGKDGKDGEDGKTPSFSIGTVTTLPAGSPATVTITGTPEFPVLNLGIPRGEDADPAELIDDNAGEGVTNKVWSANKSAAKFTSLKSDLTELEGKEEVDRKRIAYLYSLHMDGSAATYKKLMAAYFDAAGAEEMTPEGLTQLCSDWYAGIRGNWNGSTVFYQPEVSDASTGTKTGDNAGMVCVPSTDAVAGQDDYAGLPLFAPTDVNWEIDADTLDVVITGIDGITSSFERHNPDKLVGVMQMSGWHWQDENAETFTEGYSEQYQAGHDYCKPVPEAVRVDNTMREFVVHAKYPGHVVDGKMRCYAGVIPTAWMSHNLLQTRSKANGSQYGAGSVLLQSWLILMTRIKYASLTQDGNIQGCLAYNYQYYAQVAETGVRRVILLPAHAANIEIGSGVLIGTIQRSDTSIDRAYVNNITGQRGAIVTAKEDVEIDGTQYVAVYVDTENAFDTTGEGAKVLGATVLSTFHWPTGTNDAVLGNDGSITSNTDAKHPAKLQGIEYITGAYEVFGDVILEIHPADEDHEFGYISYHTVDRSANQATSVTANYKDSGLYFDKLSSGGGWRYIMKMGFADGLYAPTQGYGSSTKCTRDAFYENTELSALALREWLAFANLYNGSGLGGLSCLHGGTAVSIAYWLFGGRPSACANRGVWGATPQ